MPPDPDYNPNIVLSSEKNNPDPALQPQFTNPAPLQPHPQPDQFGPYLIARKSYPKAFFLAFFGGFFGIDRFYLGYKKQAVIKLLTLGGIGVWWIADLILILAGNLKPKGSDYRDYEKLKTPVRALAGICIVLGGVLISLVINDTLSNSARIEANLFRASGANNAPYKVVSQTAALGETVQGSGQDKGINVSVNNVIQNPTTQGDQPNPGTEYIEVDVTVTNNTNYQTIFPGSIYYQTAKGTYLTNADYISGLLNDPNKHVTIPGKQPLSELILSPGQTNSSDYLIYDIPLGDQGKLVWFNDYYDTTSQIQGTLDLN